jgi:hypothetical protein
MSGEGPPSAKGAPVTDAPAGYSGTPLVKKLGIQPGARVLLVNAPAHYLDTLGSLPPGVVRAQRADATVDLVQHFSHECRELGPQLERYRDLLRADAVLWVCWPKKASKVASDISEDRVRELALPLGFVDVKVCAVDATWSGLKLVVRKNLR